MRKIVEGGMAYLVDGDFPNGEYTRVLAFGWSQGDDGTWSPPQTVNMPEALKKHYTHREFVLRLGPHYAAIERLRDANNALPPDQKNYDLARAFLLYDKSEFIDLEDPDLHGAFAAFVGLGLMSEAEAQEILTPNEVV